MVITANQVLLCEDDIFVQDPSRTVRVRLSDIHNSVIAHYPDKELVYPNGIEIRLNIDSIVAPIPLPQKVDFNNCKIIVENTGCSDLFLFSRVNVSHDLGYSVGKKDVDLGHFTHIPELCSGTKLLRVLDENRWTLIDNDSSNIFYRRDVLVLKDGVAINSPIAKYGTNLAIVSARYSIVDDNLKTYKNLKFIRSHNSTHVTNLFSIQYENNVEISGVCIKTPKPPYYNDFDSVFRTDNSIKILDSANITIKNVNICSNYSQETKRTKDDNCGLDNKHDGFGYSFTLNNVWNSQFINVTAKGAWAVFGANNINKMLLTNCTLSQLGSHCYSNDVTCINCTFTPFEGNITHIFNRFDCFYGTLFYKNCKFENFCPFRMSSEYNAYTGFDLIFKDCEFTLSQGAGCLVQIYFNNDVNTRKELEMKCLPNIMLLNPSFGLLSTANLTIFKFENDITWQGAFDYIKIINVTLTSSGCSLIVYESNKTLQYSNVIGRNITGVNYIQHP